MRERGRKLVAIVAALPLVVATTTVPVHAGVTGGGAFDGQGTVADFPCSVQNCGGSFTGTFVGGFAGTDSAGNAWTATWTSPTASNLTATFGYSNGVCPVGATSEAGGTFQITGGSVTDGNASAQDGTINGVFTWTGVAAGAVLLLTGESISGNGKQLSSAALPGAATAIYVPLGAALCPTPVTMQILIAGSALQAA